MRMRQSIAELERAFVEETHLDRRRRERLRQSAAQRARIRRVERRRQRSSMRFFMLVAAIVGTAVIVTIAMFETLYLLLS